VSVPQTTIPAPADVQGPKHRGAAQAQLSGSLPHGSGSQWYVGGAAPSPMGNWTQTASSPQPDPFSGHGTQTRPQSGSETDHWPPSQTASPPQQRKGIGHWRPSVVHGDPFSGRVAGHPPPASTPPLLLAVEELAVEELAVEDELDALVVPPPSATEAPATSSVRDPHAERMDAGRAIAARRRTRPTGPWREQASIRAA
jgi:hypothetical protein